MSKVCRKKYYKAYNLANKEKKREAAKAYYLANKDTLAETTKAYRLANKEVIAERGKAWRGANKEDIAEYNKAYRSENEEKRKETDKAYRLANKEKVAETKKAYAKNNKDIVNTRTAKRRAAKLERTVAWSDADAIKALYTEAQRLTEETGTQHHVDHIIPLQGELVSGLHVQNNLQVLTAYANLSKSNTFNIEERV